MQVNSLCAGTGNFDEAIREAITPEQGTVQAEQGGRFYRLLFNGHNISCRRRRGSQDSVDRPLCSLYVLIDRFCVGIAHERHKVLPGITGFWQVAGRADIGFDEMIELDLAYVRKASVATDVLVLVKTVGAVLSGRGAY